MATSKLHRRSRCLTVLMALGIVLCLVGFRAVQAAKFCAADFYVPGIPDMEPSAVDVFKMHAGHLPVDDTSNHLLFFWLVQAQTNFQHEKLVRPSRILFAWFLRHLRLIPVLGVVQENGPFKITSKGTVDVNPNTWVHNANMLYVDQPVGTGFSIADGRFDTTQAQVATHFATFLDNFFLTFPEFLRSEIYLSGESFAGQYIPYVATELLKRNKDGTAKAKLNLRGLLIGNGWIDPIRQSKAYLDFAEMHNLLDYPQYKLQAESYWDACKSQQAEVETVKNDMCDNILDQIQQNSKHGGRMCINMYDVRLRDEKPGQGCGMAWPPGLAETGKYLERTDVRTALHVENANKWKECNGNVYTGLAGDKSTPSYKLFPELLSQVSITLFNGDQDLICNYLGTTEMVAEMTWGGATGFTKDLPVLDWYVDNKLKGTYQTERNLSYILFYNASHMVPVDEPRAALDMFNRALGVNQTSIRSIVIDPATSDTIPGNGSEDLAPVTPVSGGETSGPGPKRRQYYA
ncbi:Cell death protease [Thoreauomyces humboldtii]|nr:Cell death protease [Thoreauomyces humboldtii]